MECIGGTCTKCQKGLYQYGNACYDSCPFETLADNVSLQCKWEKDKPVYIKAYTISRCVNSCGKTFHDCSCNPKCKKSGDCCTDFQFCEIVNESYSVENKIDNCKFSTEDKSVCLQCKENFYYHNNSCIRTCPEETLINKENKICIDRETSCKASNCEKCNEKNICVQCLNGYFLYEGNCLKTCPVGLRANRINFTCQQNSQYSFYWIFPSKAGCENKCGDHSIEQDCSCRHTCLRRGNCCDNFEKECREELQKEKCKLCEDCIDGVCNKCKSKSYLGENKNECKCEDGYMYDLEEDLCHKNSDFLKKKNLIPNQKFLKQNVTSQELIIDNKNININSNEDIDDQENIELSQPEVVKQIQEKKPKEVEKHDLKFVSSDKNKNIENQQIQKNENNPKISYVAKNSQSDYKPEQDKSNYQNISLNLNENKLKDDDKEDEENLNIQLNKNYTQNNINIQVEQPYIGNNSTKNNGKLNTQIKPTQLKLKESRNLKNETKKQLSENHKISNKTEKLDKINFKTLYEVNQTKTITDLPIKITSNLKTFNKIEKKENTIPSEQQNSTSIYDSLNKLKNSVFITPFPKKEKLSPQLNYAQHKESYNNSTQTQSPMINKALAEELLKSFKNVFSMHNPANKNQILNLYMNGNISINVLTGNTNPQMITQNIYNKDSYNQNHREVSNIDSQNKILPGSVGSVSINESNQSGSELVKSTRPKAPERKGRLLYRRKNNKSQENLHRQLSGQKIHTDHEQNFEEKTQLKNSLNIKPTGEERIGNYGNESLNTSSNIVYSSKLKLSNSTMNRTVNSVNLQQSNNLTNTLDELLVPFESAQSFKPFKQSNFDGDFLNSTISKKEKYHIQNNYFINDHSIKVLHSTNPSVIKVGDLPTLNNSLCNNSSRILINNNQDQIQDSLWLNNKTSGIIINNHNLNKTSKNKFNH